MADLNRDGHLDLAVERKAKSAFIRKMPSGFSS